MKKQVASTIATGDLDVSRPGLAQRHNTAHVRARGGSPSKSGPWDFVMKAAIDIEIARIVIGGSLDVRVELLPCRAGVSQHL